MTRILRWGTVGFMVVSTFGWIGWLWFMVHTPPHWLKNFIGLGYGCAFGCAIVHWFHDIQKYRQWDLDEKRWTHWHKEFKEFLKNPPPFRCPDCGIISHNPNDFHNQYCGFCCEFKGDRFR